MVDGIANLAPVEAFLNTLDERCFVRNGTRFAGADELANPASLTRWLRDQEMIDRSLAATTTDLESARALRAVLRSTLERDDTTANDPAEVLRRLAVRLQVDAQGALAVAPIGTGIEGALGSLVTRVVEARADGSWRRLRLCASPECRWAFRDTSKAGARRWCAMASCGDRHKARARRSRSGVPIVVGRELEGRSS